jgi:hypothetical protein
MQVAAPETEIYPAAQLVQELLSVDGIDPAPQATHRVDPVDDVYVPSTQAVQVVAPAALSLPWAHAEHRPAPAPL